MAEKKRIGRNAGIAIGIAATATVAAAAVGAYELWKWSKDPYATELWFGIGNKGIRITKKAEPNQYRVQTGVRWRDDGTADALSGLEEPEIEIPLPEDLDDLPEDGNEA